MSQSDMNVANGSGAVVRADINDHLGALVTLSSGAVAPATTFAGMLWFDTSVNILKRRNQVNTAWINVDSSDETNDENVPYSRATPLDLKERAIANADATPDLSSGIHHVTANVGATTITAPENGAYAGDRKTIRAGDANTTLAAALLSTGVARTLGLDDTWEGMWDGAAWNQVGGSINLMGAQSIGANGYLTLPNETIIQWGVNSASTAGGSTYNFPVAFPNNVRVIVGVANNQVSAGVRAAAISTSQFTLESSSGTPSINWIAIGE